MRCPTCPQRSDLVTTELEPHLAAHTCAPCGGHWLRAASYWKWRALGGAAAETNGGAIPEIEVRDHAGVLQCPDCRHILGRYRVGARVPFTIDRCRSCEGAWFDAGEWTALRAGEFHLRLHEIFTDEWQKQVRDEHRKEREEAQWERQLGTADHRRMRHVRAWIDEHPKRSELYAYLGVHEAVRTARPAGDDRGIGSNPAS